MSSLSTCQRGRHVPALIDVGMHVAEKRALRALNTRVTRVEAHRGDLIN